MTPVGHRGVRLAVTGGLACGKSTVGAILRGQGFDVLEADEVAHRLLEPGRRAYRRIVAHFGRTVLKADGRIDRKVLGDRVFGDAGLRKALNGLMHPGVRRFCGCWSRQRAARGRRVAVIVPLLFEAGMERDGWDAVWCVTADEKRVRRRLRQRGWNPAAAEARLAAQWPVTEKVRRADLVIENNGSLRTLREGVLRALDRWSGKKGNGMP